PQFARHRRTGNGRQRHAALSRRSADHQSRRPPRTLGASETPLRRRAASARPGRLRLAARARAGRHRSGTRPRAAPRDCGAMTLSPRSVSAGRPSVFAKASMAERVYIETTVVSYLTARPNRDVVIAGHQQVTHDWWDTQRGKFELCVSQLVVGEA